MPVLRFLRVVLAASLKSRLGPLDESLLRVRVWPNDLDVNRHLNNGRAMNLTDLGRWDLLVRSGLWKVALRRKWGTAVALAHVRFRRPGRLFQRLTLRTRILCWDARWIYMEHRLEDAAGGVVLRSLLQTAVVGGGKVIPTDELMRAMAIETPSPPMPEELRRWLDATATAQEAGKERKGQAELAAAQ